MNIDQKHNLANLTKEWKRRNLVLALVLLVTGMCWLGEGLQRYTSNESQLPSSIVFELPFSIGSLEMSWLALWTWALLVFVFHLVISGKLARPAP